MIKYKYKWFSETIKFSNTHYLMWFFFPETNSPTSNMKFKIKIVASSSGIDLFWFFILAVKKLSQKMAINISILCKTLLIAWKYVC